MINGRGRAAPGRQGRRKAERVLKHTSAKARWASALGYGGRDGEGPSCRHAYPGFSIHRHSLPRRPIPPHLAIT
eukprot:scaffold2199_cov134-Isochrysis_galbana.AAC.4